jgi:uncharacterized protein YcbX
MMQVSALYIYPIKSLGGISLTEALVEERGFRYDRRFMLVTPDGHCLTQHRNHRMALLEVTIAGRCLRVWHRHQPADSLELPLTVESVPDAPVCAVHIWDSRNVKALVVSAEADRWFSRTLGESCSLVFMPPLSRRAVNPVYARYQEMVSFADAYPYLLIGQASLDDLNQRLKQPLEMLRFRPNIVLSGGSPYEEETWEQFQIGQQLFYPGESCGRCILTNLDPATGQPGPEPLRTLATYRHRDNKLVFGQYVLAVAREGFGPGADSSAGESSCLRLGQFVRVLGRPLVTDLSSLA